MIPLRLALSGFLSYKQEQEIDFSGSSLWMLSGRNGSGKSALFDAMTYAFFGYHRGGSQQIQELINKECNNLAVEFAFSIDEQIYRIRRTAKRTVRGGPSGTQQIYRGKLDAVSQQVSWEPIDDTNRKTAFDAWIRDTIGLTYETFTSSVLLLQGKSEKLLDSKPAGRAELLASIVDLERYRRLHEKADAKRKSFKEKLELQSTRRDTLPEITEEQIQGSAERIVTAEQQCQVTRDAIERSRQVEFQALKWEELQASIARLQQQWKQANELLDDATKIEADHRRLLELQVVLPHINAIQQQLADINASKERSDRFLEARKQIHSTRAEQNAAFDQARQKRTALQEQQTKDEQKLQKIGADLREIAAVIERVRLFEIEQIRLADVQKQLQGFPADPVRVETDLRSKLEHGLEAAAVFPSLERFAQNRTELGQFRESLERSTRKEQEMRAAGLEALANMQRDKQDYEEACKNRESTDAQLTEKRTLLQQARSALAEFEQFEGQKLCRHCGQTLTIAHFQEEIRKRKQACKEGECAGETARKQQAQAKEVELQKQNALNESEKKLAHDRETYRDLTRAIDQTSKDVERCDQECRRTFESLPARYRARIASTNSVDWLTTHYPEETDLKNLGQEIASLAGERDNLRRAEENRRKWEKLRIEEESSKQTLERLLSELPVKDHQSIRRKHATLQAEESASKNRLSGLKSSLQENQIEIDRLQTDKTRIEKQLADVETKLSMEEVGRKSADGVIERARRQLPDEWKERAQTVGLGGQHQWSVELDDLLEKGTLQLYQQLLQSRGGIDKLAQDLAQTQAAADAIPEEARKPVADIRRQLQDLNREESEQRELLQAAQQEKAILTLQREQRLALDREILEVERELSHFGILAQLLGRDRLQRHLVRLAEKQIVDHADAVLDRLSGGQMRLRSSAHSDGTSPDHALELEAYNHVTGESPINVAFLSGSQRFRVAVSLALGIGRYASRQHRPIESVIIDEGFGSLDREGRQGMIQELQNLRGQLKCILLVSHQEEFADAFPDGYHFELQNGTTRVSRVMR